MPGASQTGTTYAYEIDNDLGTLIHNYPGATPDLTYAHTYSASGRLLTTVTSEVLNRYVVPDAPGTQTYAAANPLNQYPSVTPIGGSAAIDFSQRSLIELFALVGKSIRFLYRPLPNDLPSWIREAPQHSKGIVEFDEESRVWMMRVAFYLGEFFVHSHPKLRWDVGNANFANHNLPVVAGFKGHQELPPLAVTEGMYVRVLTQGKSWAQVETMIKSWQGSVE